MASPKVSVLIGSRNRVEVLAKCIESVLKQSFADREIVVLDDASDPAYPGWLQDRYGVRLVRSDRQLGVPGGRNLLAREARGEYLVYIDDDAVFADDDALGKVVAAFEEDPQVGILAFKIVELEGEETRLILPFPKTFLSRDPKLVDRRSLVSYFSGGGHALKNVLMKRLGGYLGVFGPYGAEELDIACGALRLGYIIKYIPDIVVIHTPQPVVAGENNVGSEIESLVMNKILFSYRHLPLRYLTVHLSIWMLRYFFRALRFGVTKSWFSGVKIALDTLRNVRREPLPPGAVRYMKANYGRLWY